MLRRPASCGSDHAFVESAVAPLRLGSLAAGHRFVVECVLTGQCHAHAHAPIHAHAHVPCSLRGHAHACQPGGLQAALRSAGSQPEVQAICSSMGPPDLAQGATPGAVVPVAARPAAPKRFVRQQVMRLMARVPACLQACAHRHTDTRRSRRTYCTMRASKRRSQCCLATTTLRCAAACAGLCLQLRAESCALRRSTRRCGGSGSLVRAWWPCSSPRGSSCMPAS